MATPTSLLMTPLNWVVDQVTAAVAGRPATLRWDANPLEVMRGRGRLVTIGVEELRVAGLTVDRAVVRVERPQIHPGRRPPPAGRRRAQLARPGRRAQPHR
jgi:hypothetical protein